MGSPPLGFFLLTVLLWLPSALNAKAGKVFFSNGHWLKGDIQVQQDSSGKKIVVVAMESGSVILDRSEVKHIVYSAPSSSGKSFSPRQSDSDRVFHKALKNTVSAPSSAKKSPTLYDPYIRQASSKHQLDPELVKAVIKQESNFNRRDVSNKGAVGLMQLMPETARGLGVQDAFDPWENIHGGTRYLKMMLKNFNGDLSKALAAYNAGPGAVKKYGAVPPYRETEGYVRNVLRYYRMYSGGPLFAFEDDKGGLVFTDKPYYP